MKRMMKEADEKEGIKSPATLRDIEKRLDILEENVRLLLNTFTREGKEIKAPASIITPEEEVEPWKATSGAIPASMRSREASEATPPTIREGGPSSRARAVSSTVWGSDERAPLLAMEKIRGVSREGELLKAACRVSGQKWDKIAKNDILS